MIERTLNILIWDPLGGSFCGLPLPLPLLVAAIIRAPANYCVVHLVIFIFYTYLLKADGQSSPPGFNESKDHVDKLTGRAVAPVIAFQSNQHLRISL